MMRLLIKIFLKERLESAAYRGTFLRIILEKMMMVFLFVQKNACLRLMKKTPPLSDSLPDIAKDCLNIAS